MGKEESRDEDRHGEGRAGEIKQGRGAAEGIGGLGRKEKWERNLYLINIQW